MILLMVIGEVLTEIQETIDIVYKRFDDQSLFFHTAKHISQVVMRVEELCVYYQLSEAETFIVSAAAWFHDLGYLNGGAALHEYESAKMAARFLNDRLENKDVLLRIQECILATALPHRPGTLLEKIICDADLYHLGTKDFFAWDALMRKETEFKAGKIDDKKWLDGSIHFLESQQFHTSYCQQNLGRQKQLNLDTLKKMLQKISI